MRGRASYRILQQWKLYSQQLLLEYYIDGKWSWTIMDKEIKPETLYQGIKQRTSILTIVKLSDTQLIMRETEEGTPDDQYFELKYKPRLE